MFVCLFVVVTSVPQNLSSNQGHVGKSITTLVSGWLSGVNAMLVVDDVLGPSIKIKPLPIMLAAHRLSSLLQI